MTDEGAGGVARLHVPSPCDGVRAGRIASALEASTVGTWEWDAVEDSLWLSPTVERIFGLSSGELERRPSALETLVDLEDRDRLRAALDDALRSGAPLVLRARARARDGSPRSIELRGAVSPGPDAAARYVTGVCHDITRQVRREEGDAFLAEAAQILGRALNYEQSLALIGSLAVPDLADWCTIDLVARDNETREPPVRRVFAACASPEQLDQVQRLGGELSPLPFGSPPALRSGESQLVEDLTPSVLDADPADEHARCVLALGIRSFLTVPLRSEGKILGALTLATAQSGRRYDREDLRRAHRLAHQVANAVERALDHRRISRAVAVRNEVLAIVSHDLRNPLNTIRMASTLLREEAALPIVHTRLDAVDRSVERAARLIDDLLDVARAEAGSLSIMTAATPVGPILREVRSAFSAQARSAGVRLVIRVALTEDVMADRARIVQVLSNLVGNAVRHTPSGGRVEIAAERRDDACLFTVEDDGPGIALEQRRELFQPFSQARGQRETGAAGLGLAIARAIVEAHEGRIWLDEAYERGARFCFVLPLAHTKKHSSGRMRAIDDSSDV